MNGISLKPWMIAAFCIATMVSCSEMVGTVSKDAVDQIQAAALPISRKILSARSILPPDWMIPGYPIPMNRATFNTADRGELG
uniref:Uncharacterized protein n=1 Tax=Bosea sp. NBC_00436 TaxID=2969620 RepID=A0A9E8CMH9_9HYPH